MSPPAFPRIITERLLLRPFKFSDAGSVALFMQDPLLAESLPHAERPYTPDHARDWIATHPFEYAGHGALHLALELRSNQLLAGAVGLSPQPENHRAEIGFWIGAPYRNRGLCTEALKAVLDYAFQRARLTEVLAFCHAANRASQRILEKLGFTPDPQNNPDDARLSDNRKVFVSNAAPRDKV